MSSLEGAEGGKEGAEGKFYYHRDTEGTEFRRNPNFRKSDTIRFPFFKSETNPFPFSELRVLCVFVVINSPSVLSSPPLRSHSAQGWEELSRVLPLLVASLIRMLR